MTGGNEPSNSPCSQTGLWRALWKTISPPSFCFSHLKGAVLLAIGQVMYGKGQQCPPIVGHFPALDLMLPASSLPWRHYRVAMTKTETRGWMAEHGFRSYPSLILPSFPSGLHQPPPWRVPVRKLWGTVFCGCMLVATLTDAPSVGDRHTWDRFVSPLIRDLKIWKY